MKNMWIVSAALTFAISGAAFYLRFHTVICTVATNPWAHGDFQSLRTQLMVYKAVHGTFPSTEQGLEALVTRPMTAPIPPNWLKLMDKIPNDPWGQPYIYRFEVRELHAKDRSDPAQPTLFSLGRDRVESGDDIYPPN